MLKLLHNCTSKTMLKIHQARLQQYMNQEIPDVQVGFRKDRGIKDIIGDIHWIIEKAREFQKTSASALMTTPKPWLCQFSSVSQSCPTLCDPINRSMPRPPCPSQTPGVYPKPCPLCQWYHPTISSSVIPFSSCPQSFQASGSFQMSQLFASGGQSIGVSISASVLPMNTQDWSPLGWTGWIS